MLPTGLSLFCAYFAFLQIPVSQVGRKKKIALLRYSPLLLILRKFRQSRQPFSPYFSFHSVKRRDFPGNVSSGGCDSLLLVLALTSKQHDSLLGYVLHFLYIRSCRLCRRCTTGLFLPPCEKRSREELIPSNSSLLFSSRLSRGPQNREQQMCWVWLVDGETRHQTARTHQCCLASSVKWPTQLPLHKISLITSMLKRHISQRIWIL